MVYDDPLKRDRYAIVAMNEPAEVQTTVRQAHADIWGSQHVGLTRNVFRHPFHEAPVRLIGAPGDVYAELNHLIRDAGRSNGADQHVRRTLNSTRLRRIAAATPNGEPYREVCQRRRRRRHISILRIYVRDIVQ